MTDEVFSHLFSRARRSGHPIRALHVGDTYLQPPECARVESIRCSDHPRLYNYAPVRGETELIAAFQRRILECTGEEIDPDLIQVTLGATGGIAVTIDALLSPGEELILLAPFWPLVRGSARRRGVRVIEVPFWD
ncbi:MAG: aminotransferase class I/II-fold pyridoxal phosphate-dependent enzyme, partial [Deltaproteobacteria bacterium]|nr:aminotransferase class I/II-fold pyridoxal phosphate-dependent enzyme [Deltaproteobacteria bacterium]